MSKPAASDGFVPISPNPYIVGNPVKDPSMFYGRETDFEFVRNRFAESTGEGGLLVFCGERRSGKTSILFQIQGGRLGEDFIPVLIDMQAMSIEDEASFLRKICEEIVGKIDVELPVPDYRAGKPAATFERFVKQVLEKHPKKKLILLIDEYELLENKIDAGVLSQDVLQTLGHIMEHLKVFVIFTGSTGLEHRKRDYWGLLLPRSISRRVSYLQYDDAVRLISEPVWGRVRYEEGVIEGIYRASAGQPFYTQGICQWLVDFLNDHHSNDATRDALEQVVRRIVDDPFPQMAYMWGGLSHDEKIVLALLAETLTDSKSYAPAEQVQKRIKAGKYPLDLTFARVSQTLEGLAEKEMLVKSFDKTPGFAFRMDLWRHWVKRAHSVWQVMREVGLKLRKSHGALRVPILAASIGGLLLLGALLVWQVVKPSPPALPDPPSAHIDNGYVAIDVGGEVDVLIDGNIRWVGAYADSLEAGTHTARLRSAGYRDSTIAFAVQAGATYRSEKIRLSPLLGRVHIETEPTPADVRIDGGAWAPSPLERTLPVPGEHLLEVRLDGHLPVSRTFRVFADSQVVIKESLLEPTGTLRVDTEPQGAAIHVDGKALGNPSPCLISLAAGEHRVRAELAGYLVADASHTVTDGQETRVTLRLVPEPMGCLVVTAGEQAVFYVNNIPVKSGVMTTGNMTYPGGSYWVRVTLERGASDSAQVDVEAGRRRVYDFREKRVVKDEEWPGGGE